MTTTAFDDKFTVGTQTIVLHKAYDTVAILRRNVADLEVALRKQTERAESYAETLRSLASYVGAGGYNADTVDAGVFEEKIRWGIGEIMKRMEKVEAELESLRWQKPVATLLLSYDGADFEMYYDNNKLRFEGMSMKLYAAPVPVPAVPATCNDSLQVDIREMLQWLIDQRGKHGHNHKQSGIWDDDNGAMAGKPCEDCAMYDKARALLQSAPQSGSEPQKQYAWECNKCGAQEYTMSVVQSIIESGALACGSCGCDEFHKAEVTK